jgi:hypothetical protein
MNNLRSLLQEGDPLAREAGLSPIEANRMRHVVLSAADRGVVRNLRLALPIAAMLFVVTTGAAWFIARAPENDEVPSQTALRQLQFSSAGGTRVIWTFNPDLEVR